MVGDSLANWGVRLGHCPATLVCVFDNEMSRRWGDVRRGYEHESPSDRAVPFRTNSQSALSDTNAPASQQGRA